MFFFEKFKLAKLEHQSWMKNFIDWLFKLNFDLSLICLTENIKSFLLQSIFIVSAFSVYLRSWKKQTKFYWQFVEILCNHLLQRNQFESIIQRRKKINREMLKTEATPAMFKSKTDHKRNISFLMLVFIFARSYLSKLNRPTIILKNFLISVIKKKQQLASNFHGQCLSSAICALSLLSLHLW